MPRGLDGEALRSGIAAAFVDDLTDVLVVAEVVVAAVLAGVLFAAAVPAARTSGALGATGAAPAPVERRTVVADRGVENAARAVGVALP